ncbi:MAG: cupin domain-containing protein [Anaerolineaceae bacterium]|nr:cupin domain-containing protein [Anaerolineaceae bacterium]
METATLADDVTTLAPDGSEIRTLLARPGGSLVHCTLPAGQTTAAVRHRTVEELWFILYGTGELWRKDEEREIITELRPGVAVDIPLGVSFQFRNCGAEPLQFLICTMPPWPGEEEAFPVAGKWEA